MLVIHHPGPVGIFADGRAYVAIGVACVAWLIVRRTWRGGVPVWQSVPILLTWLLWAGLLGRVFHRAYSGESLLAANYMRGFWNPAQGLWSIVGVIAALPLTCLFAQVCGVSGRSIMLVLQEASRALPLGQAVGRVGCLMHGCCYGSPASRGLVIVYDPSTWAGVRYGSRPLYAVQLYESLLLLAVWLAFAVGWKTLGGLRAFPAYLMAYGLIRLLTLPFRGDGPASWGAPLGPYWQATALVVFGLGGLVVLASVRRPNLAHA